MTNFVHCARIISHFTFMYAGQAIIMNHHVNILLFFRILELLNMTQAKILENCVISRTFCLSGDRASEID